MVPPSACVSSSWDKGGFGVLEQVDPEEAAPLIARGARIDVWAAANLGMTAELAALIAGDPSLVHAKLRKHFVRA